MTRPRPVDGPPTLPVPTGTHTRTGPCGPWARAHDPREAGAAVEAVATLTTDLGNPTRISEIGVDASGVAALAEDAFNDVCTPGNPRPATREDIEALYRSLL